MPWAAIQVHKGFGVATAAHYAPNNYVLLQRLTEFLGPPANRSLSAGAAVDANSTGALGIASGP